MQLICTVMQADVVPQTQGVHQRSEFRLNCHIVVFPAQHGLYVVDIFAICAHVGGRTHVSLGCEI